MLMRVCCRVQGLEVVRVEWKSDPAGGRPQMVEVPDSAEVRPNDSARLGMTSLVTQNSGSGSRGRSEVKPSTLT